MRPASQRRPAWAFVLLACVLGHATACAPAGSATPDTPGDVWDDALEADARAQDTTGDAPEPTDAGEASDVRAPARGPDPDAHFAPLDLPALHLHAPTRAPEALASHLPAVNEGAGAAFADVDGDGDLDVFLGAVDDVGLQSCVFENTSVAGELRLEGRATWCVDGPALAVAAPIDLDGDGQHELVAASPERAYLLRFDEGVTREALPAHTPGCVLGPLAVADLDHDGSTEIIAPCQLGAEGDEADAAPRTVAWSLTGGVWEAVEASPSIAAMTLGVGHADVDGDGLLDLLSVTDTFALPDAYDPDADPGGTYFGCTDPPCADVARWSDDRHAWGSYMGLASVRINGARHFVLTDIGAPHVARWSGAAWERAEALPHDVFEPTDAPARVAWGVVADDLDDDGDDDLIFTFGVESLLLPSPRDAVASLALLQSESATFSPSERFAFPDPNDAIDPVWQLPRANRGATLVDLDLDDDAELFVLSVNGPPRVLSTARGENAAPRGCSRATWTMAALASRGEARARTRGACSRWAARPSSPRPPSSCSPLSAGRFASLRADRPRSIAARRTPSTSPSRSGSGSRVCREASVWTSTRPRWVRPRPTSACAHSAAPLWRRSSSLERVSSPATRARPRTRSWSRLRASGSRAGSPWLTRPERRLSRAWRGRRSRGARGAGPPLRGAPPSRARSRTRPCRGPS